MHVLIVKLLQGAALALLLVVARLGYFLVDCLRAKLNFLASPIPGPPLSWGLLGELVFVNQGNTHVWQMWRLLAQCGGSFVTGQLALLDWTK